MILLRLAGISMVLSFFPIDGGFAADLFVTVTQIPSQQGQLRIAIYDSEQSYESGQSVRSRVVQPQVPAMILKFEGLQAQSYAVLVHQDLNENGIVDKSLFGIPEEPVGFSNNPSLRFGKPDYSEILFDTAGQSSVSIKLLSDA